MGKKCNHEWKFIRKNGNITNIICERCKKEKKFDTYIIKPKQN